MSLYENARPNPAGHRDVSAAEVTLPAKGLRLLDVREPHEFTGELGHIPGAELVPMGAVAAHAPTWNKSEEILVICKSGGRSANIAQALTRAGFSRVMNLTGGMLGWNAAGLPVEK